MEVAILLYDRFTVLDAFGPYEVLSRVPGASVTFVAARAGLMSAESGGLAVPVERTVSEMPRPDVIVVPGGSGQMPVMADETVLSWLGEAHRTTTWTASVCTGSLVLAAAGLLNGRRATSHWLFLDQLAVFGAEPVAERVVVDDRVMTAAGVSAGIDMALELAARTAGAPVADAIQLLIEYDPRPRSDAGSPSTAAPSIVDFLRDGRDAILRTGTVDLAPLSSTDADQ
jgi:transcriptional regulator GlxA family with amidase domain